jgi:hypothetical protein
MKKALAGFVLGVIVGGLGVAAYLRDRQPAYVRASVCYSCFWKTQSAQLRKDLVDFYLQYKNPDQLVMADVSFIVWRATDQANCDARDEYRQLAESESDAYRKYMARAIYAFSGPECGQDTTAEYGKAAEVARTLGLYSDADLLDQLSRKALKPKFEDVALAWKLPAAQKARAVVLGESQLRIAGDTRIGTQVDRVSRDWLSYQLHWDLSGAPMPEKDMLTYHEGAVAQRIVQAAGVEVYPLTGTLIARKADKWYAPDEQGVFRFEVLQDKVEYPTSHAAGQFGILEDTHGVSALVSQALHRRMQVVIACGDSEGKVKAAYYLAQRGVNVIMPGDRYVDELLGYEAKGVILGTAPVRKEGAAAIVGGQPVRFSTTETIVVEDTKQRFPLQYYDAAARYFRRLAQLTPLRLEFVMVDDVDQIGRVLQRADELGATAVGVRVVDQAEHDALAAWLKAKPERRAVLFHSGLYPFAQPLFDTFPKQVTFGDLHPRFE